jgi:indolepyruvate ferredoxin oxidoreductase alpha subunit
VITSGLGLSYYRENADELAHRPSHLHVASYPPPLEAVRALAAAADRVLVIEEGQPYLERLLRGLRQDASAVASAEAPLFVGGKSVALSGKLDGTLPRTGELDPDSVRKALGLAPRPTLKAALSSIIPAAGSNAAGSAEFLQELPGRPPQLCAGCPHIDSYASLREALAGLESTSVTADIGCYALGALPPYDAIETIVCMGASIGMARGAADSGIPYPVAVIGDSTFLHSGITPLLDAVSANAPVTVLILDNSIVAMTGCQPTVGGPGTLESAVRGTGLDPAHLRRLDAQRGKHAENVAVLREEILHRGPSVVIMSRVCLEAFRRQRSADKAAAAREGGGSGA